MEIIIQKINAHSKYLNQVIRYGDKYSKFLGFFPRNAFIEASKQGKILIALSGDICLGYLLYRLVKKQNKISITHLCVGEEYRFKGVGRKLVEFLIEDTRDCYGIGLFCRRDYESNKFWKKIGFSYIGEKTGRGKDKEALTYYWYDHNHPTLISYANKEIISSKTYKAIIDMNIFVEMFDNRNHPLLADWILEDLNLCVSPEISNEICRNQDKEVRIKMLDYLSIFPIEKIENQYVDSISSIISGYYPSDLSDQDESDINQISAAVAASADFFVTHDRSLSRKLKKPIQEKFGLSIVSSDDLIVYFDKLIHEITYQSSRLAGSLVEISRLTSEDIEKVADFFLNTKYERKGVFRENLRRYLSYPRKNESFLVTTNSKEPIAFVVLSEVDSNTIEIPIIRTINNSKSHDLESQLIFWSVTRAVERNYKFVKISDNSISDNMRMGLKENSFTILHGGEWVKINLKGVQRLKDLHRDINEFLFSNNSYGPLFNYLNDVIDEIESQKKFERIITLEKHLWPVKVYTPYIRNFLVPIQANWAMDLFDYKLGSQILFGSNPDLVFKMENVYYRSSKTKVPTAQSRVLWYVSQGSNKDLQGTMAIRACSYVDGVEIDTPKRIFSRNKKLGVYNWQNLLNTTKGDLLKELLCFRFSRTEIFKTPITLKAYKQISGKKCAPQSTQIIDDELFYKLYSCGF